MTSPHAHLSFHLSDDFVNSYSTKPVDWGFFMGAGNFLGEFIFVTKYARKKADGTKERWHEACRRVIEGMFSIQKDHCLSNRIPWNANKAQRAAEEAFDRMFKMKWLPPGRGIQHMGTPFVWEEGSAALQNCAFVSTAKLGPRNPTQPFGRLMEMSMLGIGVGFDTLGAGKLTIHKPTDEVMVFVVPDSREGWVESVELKLKSYLTPNHPTVQPDYSLVRPEGMPLKRFGGFSAGPEPLKQLHRLLDELFEGREGTSLTASDITDVMNMEGHCVVAGSQRRSAELALGHHADTEYLNLKNPFGNARRLGFLPDDKNFPIPGENGIWLDHPEGGWGYMSNNSVIANVGDNLDHISELVAINGEPGIYYIDLARQYGRLVDPPNNRDYRVMGLNPCAEQTLEDQECCTLVEVFPTRCDDKSDYLRTLKFAYLYGKSVTLMMTHWAETNEVMTRNRRIGTSMTGVAQFADREGWTALRTWCDEGYAVVDRYDTSFSEWLGVRESIKMTSVKPSGTVSLLAGVWPGVHWPVAAGEYFRRVREKSSSMIVDVIRAAGYPVEADKKDPKFTVVFTFPVSGPPGRSEREVPVWEKVHLAATMQRYWADNAVSATFTFLPEEANQIPSVVRAFDGQLKTLSFLPLGQAQVYPQMPYEAVDAYKFEKLITKVKPINWDLLYAESDEGADEKFCTNDVCTI